MNETEIKNAEVDEVLTTYFQAQLPQAWPAWRAPEATPARRRPLRLPMRRLAVAASVAALLAGYLALAGFFPREGSGRLNNDRSRDIGSLPVPKALTPIR